MARIDDFKARFPEFDTGLVDDNFDRLDAVWPSYFSKPYTDETKEAILNLIAHLLVSQAVNTSSGASKEVTSTTVGSVSESYASGGNVTDRTSFFRSTKYGQAFLMLAKFCGGAVFR